MVAPHVAALAAGMLVAGTINTVATKLQDMTPVDADGTLFYHPALQSAAMFLGEALCLGGAAFQTARAGRRRGGTAAARAPSRASRTAILAFALPAACDAAATTALNMGLALTSASSFQMLRGTLVAWAGLFTQVLLRRRLRAHHWFGIFLIAAGAAVVGAATVVFEGGGGGGGGGGRGGVAAGGLPSPSSPPPPPSPASASNPALGITLIIASQAVTALQFILEEALLSRHRLPALLAVGLEGAWGLVLCAAALPLLGAPFSRPDGSLAPPIDDVHAGLAAVAASPRLAGSMALTIASIAAFNACGLSVTKRLSGAGRAATDATRTLAVWGVALVAGWETFGPGGWLKVLGFALLLLGAALFNGLVRACLPRVGGGGGGDGEEAERAPLLVPADEEAAAAAAAVAAPSAGRPAPPRPARPRPPPRPPWPPAAPPCPHTTPTSPAPCACRRPPCPRTRCWAVRRASRRGRCCWGGVGAGWARRTVRPRRAGTGRRGRGRCWRRGVRGKVGRGGRVVARHGATQQETL